MSCTTCGSDGSAVSPHVASHVHEQALEAQGSILARAPSLAVPDRGTQASHVHERELEAQGLVLARAPSSMVPGRATQAVGHRDRSLQGLQVRDGGRGRLLVKPGGVEVFEVWMR